MRIGFAIAAVITALAAHAHEPERMFLQASELVPWCRAEAEARYIAKSMSPYQWTASYREDGNVLIVDGKLRVHGDDVGVHCRIAKGAREQYASVEIDDPHAP